MRLRIIKNLSKTSMTTHRRNMSTEDYLKVDTKTLMQELREFSEKYNFWYSALLKRETDLKQKNAELYISFKNKEEKMTQKEIEALIMLDEEYKSKKHVLVEAETFYLMFKTNYNNKQTEISLLQSELKRELSFVARERK